jgi:oligosaccharyltransferase complex subunit gamma
VWVVVVLLVVTIVVDANGAKKTATTGLDRIQQISDLSAKSRGNMITLDDSTYQYYATAKPRPYSLIVFMTAAHPKFKCNVCKQIDQEMAMVAQAYNKAIDSNKESPNVFFVRLDYESAPKTFQSYGAQSVPMLFYIPPSVAADGEGKEFVINPRDKYQVPASPDAESIAGFLRDRTGISVEIKRSMIMSYVVLAIVFGIMIALVKPVIDSLPFLLGLIRNTRLWAVVSAGVYTCAISGLIFDIIRSPQMYYANPQTGQIMFFYPQSGNQFVVEGFVIGFLNLASSIALIAVAVYLPKIKDAQTRNIAMGVGIFAFIFCFRSVRSLYIMKNQWYGHMN